MNTKTICIQVKRFVRFAIIGQTFFISGILISIFSFSAYSQAVIYDEFPITAQIYQRDDLNRGTVTIKGRLYTEGFTDVAVIAKKDKKDIYYKKQKLIFQPGDLLNAPFLFQPLITSGLVEYEFYFYAFKGPDSVLVREATQVLCGDNIIIYGQSNAEANDGNELLKFKDEFKYGRTTFANFQTNDYSWFPTMKWNYYMSGLIGLEIQKQLIEKYKVPIGVINGAVGNKSIDELMIRNEKNHEDIQYYYGQMLKKANKVGLSKTAKIFIWRQGESEAFEANRAEVYPGKFAQLRKQILEDYPGVKKIYVFQNNIYWTDNNKAGDLRDFQRKVNQIYPDCEGLSTIGTPGFDGLHYTFEGYQQNGQELSRLIAKDFMNSTDTSEVHTPNIKKAYFSENRDSLTLEFDKNQKMQYPNYSVTKNGGGVAFFKDYVYLDGEGGKVVGGSATGNKIKLKLSEPSNARQVTYCPDNFTLNSESLMGIPYLKNSRGLRAFTFKNFPISLHVNTPKPVLDVSLNSGPHNGFSLFWSGQNNLVYSVEKSVGSPNNFVKIATILLSQTSGSYLDLKVKKGVAYYYRVSIDDEVFSNNVMATLPLNPIGFTETENDVLIFPNPASKGSDININIRASVSELRLSNNQGSTILKIPVIGRSVVFPTSKLNPGIYLIEGITTDNQKITKKLIID
ncbi:sialate O-acetylesterase [Emticicia sp. BO119]|uniref:sialate O-acetylesterase n=1 Tax=Emticicia sp. BO119 TaxID=2757768 RepID=UPI0015F0680F|nr:sialate O-acetylesterase [Emticicia sp. BO119]MBA4853606.1 T9SS type A sorting domain-containing protein [Emticicia sp. BO119]